MLITKEILKHERSAAIQEQCIDLIFGEAIRPMFYELAAEAIEEGRAAKIAAEQTSGIVFSNPIGMQYTAYCHLRDVWKSRKESLILNIKLLESTSQKNSLEAKAASVADEKNKKDGEAQAQLETEKRKRQEAFRQETLCREMAHEEFICREYYTWELKENLRERRSMREAEQETRNYMKDLKRQAEIESSSYNVMGAKAAADAIKYAGLSEADRRRQQLKDLAVERRMQANEIALMSIEDELGEELRSVDRIERQKKAFLSQLGISADDPSAEEAPKEVIPGPAKINVNETPDWMVLPPSWMEMNKIKKERYIYCQFQLRLHKTRIESNLDNDFALLDKVEKKSLTLWSERYDALRVRDLKSELDCLISEEECKEIESNLFALKENIRKLGVYCQQKGMEELKANSNVRELSELAKRRDIEYNRAKNWVDVCIQRSKQRAKVKRRVEADCNWIDTNAVNGFHQRFKTEQLRQRLYTDFFNKVVGLIACRAEIVATERRLFRTQEKLSINRHTLKAKVKQMKDLWGDYRRETFMRTRRSLLNRKFFPHSRRLVLEQRFIGWVRFYLWNRGNREAFEAKYELLKRQMDIDRQFKDQLQSQRQKRLNAGVQSTDESKTITVAPTLMERHRERTVTCKLCKHLYLESQNTSISCQYHPMKFKSECPKTCPNPGLTALCISHRTKRWPCCDKGQEHMSGCARRYHIPVDSDPIYDKVMQNVIDRDSDQLSKLDEQLHEIKQGDWIQKAQTMKRTHVFAVEDDLKMQREIDAQVTQLKYI